MTNATITSLDQLSLSTPTIISAETNVVIEGCYMHFTGNTESMVAEGARWHLCAEIDGKENDGSLPIRALVIG